MKHYKAVSQQLFFDPHGTPDDGGTEVEVFSTDVEITPLIKYLEDNYLHWPIDFKGKGQLKRIIEDFDPEDSDLGPSKDNEDLYAEDGYNYELLDVTIKEITEEEKTQAEATIKAYKKLLN